MFYVSGGRVRVWALGFVAALAIGAPSFSQPLTTLPSVKFERAELVSPAQARTFYAGQIQSHGTSFTGVTGFDGRPPEIVELARALKRSETDPGKIADLIFEHVRNTTKTELAFGLRKGALGALIDKSGTPFDQAALVVELARQAGLSARYRVGQATLTQARFANLTGVSNAQALCHLLANGGIPATFGGSAPVDCAVSGSNDITILHAWAEISVNGQWRAYDPSIKAMTTPVGRNIAAGAGFGSGVAGTKLSTGLQAGSQGAVSFIRNVNSAELDGYLAQRGVDLLNDMRNNASSSDLDAVLGEPQIVEAYVGDLDWSRNPPDGYSAATDALTFDDLPDAYRTTLKVRVEFLIYPNTPSPIERLLYVDEIYGRRLEIDTDFDDHMVSYNQQRVAIELDDIALVSWNRDCGAPSNGCTPGFSGIIELEVGHPYAAAGGAYADEIVRKQAGLTVPVAIVSGYGETSAAMAAKWAGERAEDELLPRQQGQYNCADGKEYQCYPIFRASAGDQARQRLAANWLAQMNRALVLQTRLAGAAGQHHHSIGIVAWRHDLNSRTDRTVVPGVPGSPNTMPIADWDIVDRMVSLDIDTSLSLTSKTNDAVAVRALSRSVALVAATLEGAVVEQAQDLPDGASTAERFAWANNPDEDGCHVGPRRFFDFNGLDENSLWSLMVAEGSASGCSGALPAVNPSTYESLKNQLSSAMGRYIGAHYQQVVGPNESFLGPGQRIGPEGKPACDNQAGVCAPTGYDQTRQRGGAFIATRLDTNSDDVVEIAHVIVDRDGFTKGGAGKPVDKQGVFEPGRAADALKDRFVDKSAALGVDMKSGLASYSTPTLLSVGAGAAPYGLDFQLTYKAGAPCWGTTGPCLGPVSGGWVSNWDIYFGVSGSGAETLGDSTPRAAAGALVAFLAIQDIYASNLSPLYKDVFAAQAADWWRRQMIGNVATFTRGAQGIQFVKLTDGSWFAPTNPAMTLTQVGGATKVRDTCTATPAPSRRWDWQGAAFTVRNATGDEIDFAPWVSRWSGDNDPCAFFYGFKPVKWVWPKGPRLTFTTEDFGGRVTGLTTSLGRTATVSAVGGFSSAGLTAGMIQDSGNTFVFANAKGEKTKVEFVGETLRSAVARPIPFKRIAKVYETIGAADNLADARAQLAYTFDAVGRVREAQDGIAIAGARDAYGFYFADGARAERINPLKGAFTVYFDAQGDAVRHIDELGRRTASVYDGRHRVVQRTYPEGDRDKFAYNDRDNVVELRKSPKPGFTPTPADIVVQAGWDPVWNKPSWIIDANNNRTDFKYVSSDSGKDGKGEIETATQAAVAAGQPVWRYAYNAKGLVQSTTDPLNVVTTFVYDDLGNMTQSVVDPTGLNLRTCRSYDPIGRMESETSARAAACP